MWNYIWPILLVIGSNTVYNICAKSTPAEANSFVSLSITYLVGALLSIGMFFLTSAGKDYFVELKKLNWASVVLGASVVALEFGYIAIYRAGWKVSVGSLVANIGWCDFLQRTDKYKTNLRNHAVSGRPAAAQYINVHALQKGVHVPPCCIFGLNSMSTARCSSCIRKQIS